MKNLVVIIGLSSLASDSRYGLPSVPIAVAAEQAPDTRGGALMRKGFDNTLSASEIERRVPALYDRVGPAIVRWKDEDRGGITRTGMIATAEGHILIGAIASGRKLNFQLPDGRSEAGTTLGCSGESGVGLAKLNGPGPWPHVALRGPVGVRAGECVVTLGYAYFEPPGLVPRPLLGVGSVINATPGVWFMTSDVSTFHWRDAAVVFNLDGHLVGMEAVDWFDGIAYTDSTVILTLWDDLAAGKNPGQTRL